MKRLVYYCDGCMSDIKMGESLIHFDVSFNFTQKMEIDLCGSCAHNVTSLLTNEVLGSIRSLCRIEHRECTGVCEECTSLDPNCKHPKQKPKTNQRVKYDI